MLVALVAPAAASAFPGFPFSCLPFPFSGFPFSGGPCSGGPGCSDPARSAKSTLDGIFRGWNVIGCHRGLPRRGARAHTCSSLSDWWVSRM